MVTVSIRCLHNHRVWTSLARLDGFSGYWYNHSYSVQLENTETNTGAYCNWKVASCGGVALW
jgi:hypothetical protein